MTDATAQSFVKLNIKSTDGNIVMKTGKGKTILVTAPTQGMISGREFTIDTIWSFSYDFNPKLIVNKMKSRGKVI